MTYLYNPKANPKRYGLYALCAACVGAGAACFLFTSTLVAELKQKSPWQECELAEGEIITVRQKDSWHYRRRTGRRRTRVFY